VDAEQGSGSQSALVFKKKKSISLSCISTQSHPSPNPTRSRKKEKCSGLAQSVNESQESLTKPKSRHPFIPHLQHTLTQSYQPLHKPHPHQPIPVSTRPPTHTFLPLPLIPRRIRIRRPIIPLTRRRRCATTRRCFKRGATRTAARARIPAPGRGVGVRGEVGGGGEDGVREGGGRGGGGYREGGQGCVGVRRCGSVGGG
jgi:hypothetical protein